MIIICSIKPNQLRASNPPIPTPRKTLQSALLSILLLVQEWCCRCSNDSIQIEFELREFSLYYFLEPIPLRRLLSPSPSTIEFASTVYSSKLGNAKCCPPFLGILLLWQWRLEQIILIKPRHGSFRGHNVIPFRWTLTLNTHCHPHSQFLFTGRTNDNLSPPALGSRGNSGKDLFY